LSEWPLALFPEPKPGPKIKVKQAILPVDPGPLPEMEELRLDRSNENPQVSSTVSSSMCVVDIRKCVGLFSRLPNLLSLEIRGGHHSLSSQQLDACRPALGNIKTLNLIATSKSTVNDILLACSRKSLEHFRFTIPPGPDGPLRYGNDIEGHTIVDLLKKSHLSNGLKTLQLDTSESTTFAADPHDVRLTFRTVESLRSFASLRRLIISADSIYYPSQYPRVLLRDANTGNKKGMRLINFLPRNLESVCITGIYAIPIIDLLKLPKECHNQGLFPQLKNVTLRGHKNVHAVTNAVSWTPYPVPEDSEVSDCANWRGVEEHLKQYGSVTNGRIAECYTEAGVRYDFDMPEFLFDKYAGDWNQDPRAEI
jgi:hypothetical protein